MLVIENTVVSEQIFQSRFLCDLHRCKGHCCVEGVAGAPLEESEKAQLEHYLPQVIKYLSQEAQEIITQNGAYVEDAEYGLVTPTIRGGICVYGIENPVTGIVECVFQKYAQNFKNSSKADFPKPISCHLYPIRIKKTAVNELLNYEQNSLCSCAKIKGKEAKLPLFRFLKTALIRKYGEQYYQALEEVYTQFFQR